MSTIRQRRPRSTTTQEDQDDDHLFLDQDDQVQVIQKLRKEAQELDQHMNRVMNIAALFLIAGFWILILSAPGESKWPFILHGIYASILCVLSASSFTTKSSSSSWQIMSCWIIAVLIPLLIVLLVFHIAQTTNTNTDTNNTSTSTTATTTSPKLEALEFHHIVITAGNGFMLLLSYIMKQDAQSTSQDLNDLETKQYPYKSL